MNRIPLLLLVTIGACYDARRPEDPWEKYANADPGPGNIRIDVRTFIFSAEDATYYEAALQYRGDRITVSAGGFSDRTGLILFGGRSDFLGAFRLASRKARTREERQTFVVVADGAEAQISMLDKRFVPVTRVIPIYRGAVLVRTLETVVTGSGLYVKPKRTDRGTIILDIVPFLATQDSGRGRPIRITELRTTVEVTPGKPLVLMADERYRSSFGWALLSGGSRRQSRRILQVLTVK